VIEGDSVATDVSGDVPTKESHARNALSIYVNKVLGADYSGGYRDNSSCMVKRFDLLLTYPLWQEHGVFLGLAATSEKGCERRIRLLG
jgi:hypothetical protein